jgi:hypothetical protein
MPFVKTEVRYQAIFKQSLKMATGHHLSVAELIRYRLTPSAAPQNLKSTTVPAISQSVSRESVHIESAASRFTLIYPSVDLCGLATFSDGSLLWSTRDASVKDAGFQPLVRQHGQGSASGEFKALTVE